MGSQLLVGNRHTIQITFSIAFRNSGRKALTSRVPKAGSIIFLCLLWTSPVGKTRLKQYSAGWRTMYLLPKGDHGPRVTHSWREIPQASYNWTMKSDRYVVTLWDRRQTVDPPVNGRSIRVNCSITMRGLTPKLALIRQTLPNSSCHCFSVTPHSGITRSGIFPSWNLQISNVQLGMRFHEPNQKDLDFGPRMCAIEIRVYRRWAA